jgi:hypothetical protein
MNKKKRSPSLRPAGSEHTEHANRTLLPKNRRREKREERREKREEGKSAHRRSHQTLPEGCVPNFVYVWRPDRRQRLARPIG